MGTSDLLTAIRESMRELVGPRRAVAVAYSGGLDSSIVARVASEIASVKCYTAAFPGSRDHSSVERLAEEEDLSVVLLGLDAQRIGPLMAEASAALNSQDPVRISYTIPILRVLEDCAEDLVLVGSGADELFGGYAKYSSMDDPSSAMRSDFEKALAELAGLRTAAQSRGKHLGAPLASDRVRSLAEELPLSSKIRGNERKVALRKIAAELNLPSHSRPKKAAQYSSGVLREMKRLANASQMRLPEWTRMMLEKEPACKRGVQSP